MNKLLEVNNLKVSFNTEMGKVEAVKDFTFDVRKGEILAVVGESGSGKSVSAQCITGLLARAGAVIEGGSVSFMGSRIDYNDEKALRMLRGGGIAYIFQEPMASLNPLHTIEKQITERLIYVEKMPKARAAERALELLKLVGIRNPEERMNDLPHTFSGGERQRIMIAAALACDPALLIADEPTTALDVTVQKQILDLIVSLRESRDMSILLITHDLGIVRRYADRVVVVKDGLVVESGDKERIFNNPSSPYTKELTGKEPMLAESFVDSGRVVLRAEDITVKYTGMTRRFGKKRTKTAVDKVSFELMKGASLGIVGESGSGKTSLARAILRLIPSEGKVVFDDSIFSSLGASDLRKQRKNFQMVFQDPFGSLNPRMTVNMIVAEGLRAQGIKDAGAVSRALTDVGLDPSIADRYPHEFSGGQRQRIAIARAIVLRPKVVIFDEPTSSLDRSVQFQVVELLKSLQKTYAMSYIFISHDLHLVRAVCHDIVVMKDGVCVERGRTADVLAAPKERYTKALVDAAFLS